MAAALSLAGSQKGSTIVAIAIPLVSFGLPVVEAGLSLARRFLSGQPLLAGDRGHIHHRLLELGLTQRQTAILLYAVCALFSLFGLMLLNPQRNIGALIFFVLGVVIIVGVQHLRYAEFSELGSQIKQGVSRRRRALAINVRVRRTSDGLGIVKTPDQFFAALEEMFSSQEFDCAALELTDVPPIFESYSIRYRATALDKRPGNVIWIWERDDADLDEIFASDRFWTLRVPLTGESGEAIGAIVFYRRILDGATSVDINHLCGNFQRELSGAITRLMHVETEMGRNG
jgi:hypothetical protein